MDRSARISPLSLGAPQHPFLTQTSSSRPTDQKTAHTVLPSFRTLARFPLQDDWLLYSASLLPFTHRLAILDQILDVRTTNETQSKVIAVDGSDSKAIELLISSLQHYIAKTLGCVVRVVSPDLVPRAQTIPELYRFMTKVQTWGEMWAEMRGDGSFAQDPCDASVPRHGGPVMCPPSPGRSCVYILPLSPLTITMTAADRVTFPGADHDNEHFRWLASHWTGYPRPDIMINIHDVDGIVSRREVLRLQSQNMKALIVTKIADGEAIITPQQLRRVTFEVVEWLQED
ncbi:MAG: hypothetical protein Q9217_002664 [Psora testacea]